jgi:hypothetical protein
VYIAREARKISDLQKTMAGSSNNRRQQANMVLAEKEGDTAASSFDKKKVVCEQILKLNKPVYPPDSCGEKSFWISVNLTSNFVGGKFRSDRTG